MARSPLLAHAGRAGVGLAVLSSLLFSPSTAAAQQAPAAPPGEVFASSANCQVVLQQKSAEINAQHSRDWKACHGASACIRAANATKADALKQANADLRLCQASGGTMQPPPTSDTPAPGAQPVDGVIATPPRDRQPVDIPTSTVPVQGPSPSGRPAPDYGPLMTPSVSSTPVGPTPPNTAPTGTPAGGGTGGNGPGKEAPASTVLNVPPWNDVTGGGRPGTWQSVMFEGNPWAIYTDASGQPWAFRAQTADPQNSETHYRYRLDPSSLHMEPWGTDGLRPAAFHREVDDNGAFVPGGEKSRAVGKQLVKPTSPDP